MSVFAFNIFSSIYSYLSLQEGLEACAQSLQRNIKALEGLAAPDSRSAIDQAEKLYKLAEQRKDVIIREGIRGDKFAIELILKKQELLLPSTSNFLRSIAFEESQLCDSLKHVLSKTARLFLEIILYQTVAEKREVYRDTVENICRMLKKVIRSLPQKEIQTRFELRCAKAAIKASYQRQIARTIDREESITAFLSCLTGSKISVDSLLGEMSLSIYTSLDKPCYRDIWFLRWYSGSISWETAFFSKEQFTTRVFPFLRNFQDNSKSALYTAQLLISTMQNTRIEPSLKRELFDGQEISLSLLLSLVPEEKEEMRWNSSQDKFWEARYLTLNYLKELAQDGDQDIRQKSIYAILNQYLRETNRDLPIISLLQSVCSLLIPLNFEEWIKQFNLIPVDQLLEKELDHLHALQLGVDVVSYEPQIVYLKNKIKALENLKKAQLENNWDYVGVSLSSDIYEKMNAYLMGEGKLLLKEQLHKAMLARYSSSCHVILDRIVPDKDCIEKAYQTSDAEKIRACLSASTFLTEETLNIAAQYSDAHVVFKILNRGVFPSDETFQVAVKYSGDIRTLQLLIEVGVFPTEKTLREALQIKREPAVISLLLDYLTLPGEETLKMAATLSSPEILELFVKKGAIPTKKTLHAAVINNKAKAVKILLGGVVHPSEETLNLAIQHNTFQVVEMILAEDVLPTEESLALSIKRADPDIVTLLLNKDAPCSQELFVLAQKSFAGNGELIELMEKKMFVKSGKDPSFFVFRGSLEDANKVIDALDIGDNEEMLNWVIQRTSFELTQKILEKKAIPSETSFRLAFFSLQPEVLQLLEKLAREQTLDIGSSQYLTLPEESFQRLLPYWHEKTHLDLGGYHDIRDSYFQFSPKPMQHPLPYITKLNLFGCYQITNEGLKYISDAFPQLAYLNLGLSHKEPQGFITAEGMEYLTRCKGLKTLLLRERTSLNDKISLWLGQKEHFVQLESLDITNCVHISSQAITLIQDAHPLLQIQDAPLKEESFF